MEGKSLMDIFSDPSTIHSLSFGEKMLGSTVTMIMGLGITFTILLLIWIFIAIMGKVLGAAESRKKAAAAPAASAPAAAPAKAAPAAAAPAAADDSLIAVIAAAIAAYEGGSPDNLVVRKITRLSGEMTPWGTAANLARMETRKM
ncbi:MAG: OadG family protein [Firmicutes bacterium]|nr:OadG family protein [Bacillota bacterium]